ncbi:RNA-binding protein [Rhodoferax sp.]|uniref:RNA-binding protein n=1 Tax=Rhodoferax sp. TaxID=50421 RepID=UPI0025DF520B|nr:RNA-binding protein [Rhodoferax sp.]
MQNFELTSSMLTMGGAFYPTGYVFAMFARQEDAQQVVALLANDNPEKPTLLLSPQSVLDNLPHTIAAADTPLPSVGAEATSVREYVELAHQGHCALMVYASKAKESEAVMDAIRSVPFSCAKKYRTLVIEDLS